MMENGAPKSMWYTPVRVRISAHVTGADIV